MTALDFRRIALGLPEAVESADRGHPDFQAGGKIFATLDDPAEGWAMVKLTPAQQQALVIAHPGIFVPADGHWGRHGNTNVRLSNGTPAVVREALLTAWRNTSPGKLL